MLRKMVEEQVPSEDKMFLSYYFQKVSHGLLLPYNLLKAPLSSLQVTLFLPWSLLLERGSLLYGNTSLKK